MGIFALAPTQEPELAFSHELVWIVSPETGIRPSTVRWRGLSRLVDIELGFSLGSQFVGN
jgi:hypothetical protein